MNVLVNLVLNGFLFVSVFQFQHSAYLYTNRIDLDLNKIIRAHFDRKSRTGNNISLARGSSSLSVHLEEGRKEREDRSARRRSNVKRIYHAQQKIFIFSIDM